MADEKAKTIATEDDAFPRVRSPAWPFMPLGKALKRIRQFYSVHGDGPAPKSAANLAWGMGPKTGTGFQTFATLKQYGLMREASVSGSVQLTDLALQIVQDHRAVSPERNAALCDAALKPPAFADLWQKWGGRIPDDARPVYCYLWREKGFSKIVARRLVANYRATLRVAKLESHLPVDNSGNGERLQEITNRTNQPSYLPPPLLGAKPMEGERIVFTHEIKPAHRVRVLASGEVDSTLIDALEVYVQLQKKRLKGDRKASKDKAE